jgi:TetR/AcrR family acrAB operon transcriptional repressor
MATKKEIQGRQTRETIVHAAMELFAERGFHRTSIDSLSRKCRLTKGALYWHFKNKKEIFAAVVEAVRTNWLREVYSGVKAEPRALRQLSLILENHARLVECQRPVCSILIVLITEMSRSHRDFQQILQRLYTDWQSLLARIVADGKKQGEIRPDADAAQIAYNIINVLHGSVLTCLLEPEAADAPRMIRNFRKVLVEGIAAQRETLP